MNVLETVSLAKRFGRLQAVTNLDLTVPEGSVFGIVGPNGSGKTTTLGMVLGAVIPDAGRISWFGGEPRARAARRIGALLDGPAYYPSLSGEANLAIVARVRGVDAAAVAPALRRAGIYERRASTLQTYSLGMRQRLGLAAALLGDPDVVVLDEPGNGLDPEGIADLRVIARGVAARGATVVIASHVLDEIERVCTHVAVMHEGGLLTWGPLAAVIAAAGCARLEDAYLSLVRSRAATA